MYHYLMSQSFFHALQVVISFNCVYVGVIRIVVVAVPADDFFKAVGFVCIIVILLLLVLRLLTTPNLISCTLQPDVDNPNKNIMCFENTGVFLFANFQVLEPTL